jgi:hypothetical protein
MSLRDQLNQILAEILPDDPSSAINGTELVSKVRPRLIGQYATNSLRQHFSVMAGDPSSPIAKVSQGHGYYRRPVVPPGQQVSVSSPEVLHVEETGGRDLQREEKFRALFMRFAELESRFPVQIEHTAAARQHAGVNKWKFPDVVVLEWDVGRITDEGYRIDKELLEVKRSLGEQPFRLTSVELKVGLSLSSFRENFFQCVSNSRWAHHAHLVTAGALQDETLVSELRRLGTSFDVSVTSYGLPDGFLDQLPDAGSIRKSSDADIESYARNVQITQIASGKGRDSLDWKHIEDIRAQSRDFSDVFVWISRCLANGRPYSFDDFQKIENVEGEYS